MSPRRHRSTYDEEHRTLAKGPGGRNLCRWCRTEVGPGRRTFCSDACVHEWKIRSDARYARAQVFERDRGVCAICGVDAEQVARLAAQEAQRVHVIPKDDRSADLRERYGLKHVGFRHLEVWRVYVIAGDRLLDVSVTYTDVWRSSGPKRYERVYSATSTWQADHIRPVAEGGGDCGLDNLRTLCTWCHARETGLLRRRLNAARRAALEPA